MIMFTSTLRRKGNIYPVYESIRFIWDYDILYSWKWFFVRYPRVQVANVLNYILEVSEFELHLHISIHIFEKDIESLYKLLVK